MTRDGVKQDGRGAFMPDGCHGRWSRRLIPAAAVVVALSGTLLGVHGLGVTGTDETSPTLAEAITPEPLAFWFHATDEPTLVEMVSALEGVSR